MSGTEIINRVDLKNKYGISSDIIDAISRCRSLFSRVGKEWNASNREEQDYFLVEEFEKHLKMIQDSYILAESQNSTSESKQRVSKASQLSPSSELNNQPLEKKLKTNSYDTSVPNIRTCKPSLEATAPTPTQHSKIPNNNIPSNPSLGMSVGTKQESCNKDQNEDSSILTENRIQLLNEVDFEQEVRPTQSWERTYEELVRFVREFGNARGSQQFPSNPTLGKWVRKQRQNVKKYHSGDSSSLTENWIHLMNKVVFEWDCRKSQSWDTSYKELASFVEEFGHARVPVQFVQNPSLALWVKNQRQSYKDCLKDDSLSNMTEERIQLLNNVGFEWDCRKNISWDRLYEELKGFVEEFGHAKVPRHFAQNPSLGIWVKTQRQAYKKFLEGDSSTYMTEDRLRLLNKVGFVWDGDCTLIAWKGKYEELKKFVEEFGHSRVPKKFFQNPSLASWVDYQRQSYRKYLKDDSSSSMTEDRIHLLNKIGFEWGRCNEAWKRMYDELEIYVKEFGNTRVLRKFHANPQLGTWVCTQRQNYQKLLKGDPSSSMTEDRINLLNKLGMEWKVSKGKVI